MARAGLSHRASQSLVLLAIGGIERNWEGSSSTAAAVRPVPEIIGSDAASARLTTRSRCLANFANRYDCAPAVDRRATAERQERRLSKCPSTANDLPGWRLHWRGAPKPGPGVAGRRLSSSTVGPCTSVSMGLRPCFRAVDGTLHNVAKSFAACGERNVPEGLHAQLDHARVLLLQAVREGRPGIVQEAQRLRLEVVQAQRQMPGRGGNHLALQCRRRGFWMQEREVPGPDAVGRHLEPYAADAASSPRNDGDWIPDATSKVP